MQELPNRRRILLMVIGGGVVVVLLIAYLAYSATRFHIVSTSPGLKKVPSVTSFFNINFNKKLSSSGLLVSSNPSIIASSKIQDKTLIIQLKGGLIANKAYSIILNDVEDTAGNHITKKKLLFTPKNIPYQELSEEQKQAILQGQTYHPLSKNNINFLGINSLLNYGVTSRQLATLEQIVFQFRSNAATVSLDTKSISPVPHDSNSSSTSDSINFNLKIDTKTYSAKIDYSSLTILRLYLYDSQNGGLVLDSKNVSQ